MQVSDKSVTLELKDVVFTAAETFNPALIVIGDEGFECAECDALFEKDGSCNPEHFTTKETVDESGTRVITTVHR